MYTNLYSAKLLYREMVIIEPSDQERTENSKYINVNNIYSGGRVAYDVSSDMGTIGNKDFLLTWCTNIVYEPTNFYESEVKRDIYESGEPNDYRLKTITTDLMTCVDSFEGDVAWKKTHMWTRTTPDTDLILRIEGTAVHFVFSKSNFQESSRLAIMNKHSVALSLILEARVILCGGYTNPNKTKLEKRQEREIYKHLLEYFDVYHRAIGGGGIRACYNVIMESGAIRPPKKRERNRLCRAGLYSGCT